VNRREVIKALAVAPFAGQGRSAITIAGQPVEILTAPASGLTTRISTGRASPRDTVGRPREIDRHRGG